MAKERRKCRPIYEDLRPLLSLIHLYGVTWRSERGTGWRLLKFLSCVFWSIVYTCLTIFSLVGFFSELKSFRGANSERQTSNINLCIVLLSVNVTSFVVCLTQREHLDTLIRFFKKPKHEEEGENIQRWRPTVKRVATYLYALFPLYFVSACLMIAVLCKNGGGTVQGVLGHPQQLLLFILRSVVTTFVLLSQVFFFAPALFTCAMAYYVSATCEDALDRLKSRGSPVRKARMSGRVLRKCVQLGEMTAAADRLGAVTMYVLKMGAVIVFLQGALGIVNAANRKDELPTALHLSSATFLVIFSSTWLAIYFSFARLAHSASDVVTDVSKTLAEVWLRDDSRPYSVTHSRLHLINVRVDQLIQLTHLLIDRPAFTLLGEPVDGENLFSLCAEIVDSANSTLSKLKKL